MTATMTKKSHRSGLIYLIDHGCPYRKDVFIYIGRGLGIPVDLYASTANVGMNESGSIWANGLQLLEWMYPQRNWRDNPEFTQMGNKLGWGRRFNTTREPNKRGIDPIPLDAEVGLLTLASYDCGRNEISGDGVLVPVSHEQFIGIQEFVLKTYNLEWQSRESLLAELANVKKLKMIATDSMDSLQKKLGADKQVRTKLSQGEVQGHQEHMAKHRKMEIDLAFYKKLMIYLPISMLIIGVLIGLIVS